MRWFVRRHGPWLSTLAIGLALVAAGTFFVVEGLATRNEVKAQLMDEQVYTSADAAIPSVLIQDAATARAQADVIKEHTLGRWGPYSELPRDDPRRVSFIDGVALRTALNLAVVGFGISQMAIGAGAIILAAGVATLALATPALYFLAGMVVQQGAQNAQEPEAAPG